MINKEEYNKLRNSIKEELFKVLKEKDKYKAKKLRKVDQNELRILRSLGYVL